MQGICIKKNVPNKCLVLSEIIYGLFHAIDKFGDYRINIVMDFCSEYAQGHAWVTRNGKMFLLSNPSIVSSCLLRLGEDKKYIYYTYRRK